jgi:hypothetical protein
MPSVKELFFGFSLILAFCALAVLLASGHPAGILIVWAFFVGGHAYIWITERNKGYFWAAVVFAVVPAVLFILVPWINKSIG